MNTRKPILLGACALLAALGADYASALPGDEDSELRALMQTNRHKRWNLLDYSAGDCRMSGVLTIFDNGRAIWTASAMTKHSNIADIWHLSIEVFDSQNRRLFGFGQWDSPGMRPGSHYFWKERDQFPKSYFDAASTIESTSEC